MYESRGCWTFLYTRQAPKAMKASATASNVHSKPWAVHNPLFFLGQYWAFPVFVAGSWPGCCMWFNLKISMALWRSSITEKYIFFVQLQQGLRWNPLQLVAWCFLSVLVIFWSQMLVLLLTDCIGLLWGFLYVTFSQYSILPLTTAGICSYFVLSLKVLCVFLPTALVYPLTSCHPSGVCAGCGNSFTATSTQRKVTCVCVLQVRDILVTAHSG